MQKNIYFGQWQTAEGTHLASPYIFSNRREAVKFCICAAKGNCLSGSTAGWCIEDVFGNETDAGKIKNGRSMRIEPCRPNRRITDFETLAARLKESILAESLDDVDELALSIGYKASEFRKDIGDLVRKVEERMEAIK